MAAVAMLSYLQAASVTDWRNLHCESLTDPLGIDVVQPRLSWMIGDQGPETRQMQWFLERRTLRGWRGNTRRSTIRWPISPAKAPR